MINPLLLCLALVVLVGALSSLASRWARPAPLPLPAPSALPSLPPEAPVFPESGELHGDVVALVQGRRYVAALRLPAGVDRGVVEAAAGAAGFDLVEVLGERDGLWAVTGRWAKGSQSLPRPEVLERLWMLPASASPVASAPASGVAAVSAPLPAGYAPQLGELASLSDRGAREVLREAWAVERPGEELTPRIEQSLLSVARHETYYGRGWKAGSPMADSRNWGAIQHPKGPDKDGNCGPGSARQGDSKPTPQGQQSFTWCYKTYPSDLEAARDLIRTVYRGAVSRADLDSGDLDRVAWGMRRNGYFGGFCASRGPSPNPPCSVFDARMSAAQYANALERNASAMMRGIGEPLEVRRSGQLGAVPSTAADGSPVYPRPTSAAGSAAAGAALLLLVVAGVGLAREKGWILWTDWDSGPALSSASRTSRKRLVGLRAS